MFRILLVIEVHVLFTKAQTVAMVYEMLLHVHGTLKLKTLTGISCNKVDV